MVRPLCFFCFVKGGLILEKFWAQYTLVSARPPYTIYLWDIHSGYTLYRGGRGVYAIHYTLKFVLIMVLTFIIKFKADNGSHFHYQVQHHIKKARPKPG